VRFDSTDRYITALNPDDSGGVRFSATTPALGVTWRLQPELNIYAAMGHGFETPTSNELAYRGTNVSGLNLGLQPATSRHQEIGLKARLGAFGRLNLAAFTVNTDNEIVVAASSGGRTVYANGGRTERRGVEATLRGDYPLSAQATINTQAALSVLRAVYADSVGSSIIAGNRLPGVPARSLYVAADWRWAPFGLSIGGELRAVDRMFASDSNQDVTSAYAVLNLRLSVTQRTGAWQFKEFVRIDNATDRRYVGSMIANESNGRFYEPAPGRNSLLGVDVRLE
jgi:iron complex outermembrane receptor protein